MTGVIVITLVLCAAAFIIRNQERRLYEGRIRLKVYSDLLHAITELNLAGNDPYKIDAAKRSIAHTVNRLNLIAGPGVLKSTNTLLDYLHEHPDQDFDTLKLHNILNAIVTEARREIGFSSAGGEGGELSRFRFLASPKK